jgi:hypothetical protein
MTMDINDLEKEFQDLQSYSNAQFQVVLDLKKEITRLESENKSLRSMLETHTPALVQTTDLSLGISNEQLICETQICMLKEQAISRQLTKEEAQKFQIYVDILQKYKKSDNGEDFLVSKMTEEELLKVVNVSS